nr:unnamed protein product [Callosobruchus chinensis]
MEYNSRTEKMVAAALAIQKENIQTVDPTIEVSQPGTSSEQDYNPTYYESGEDPFSSDDSRADPDFSGSSSSGSPASNNSSPISCSNVARKVLNSSQITKVGKKRLRFPEKWRKNVAKALRNNGKEYVSVSKDGKVRPARTIQPPCGDKCKLQCSKKFTEEDRNLLFTEYWNLGDLQRQRDFLATNMSLVQPKYQYKRDSSHRQQNHAFYFILNNQRIRVCKCFFKATLAINDRPIRTVAQKKLLAPTGQIIEPDKRGRHGKHPKLDAAIKDGVRNHINSIPRVESHYARSNTTKQFIEGGKTIADLHRDYLLLCEEKKIPSVNYNMYSKIFNEEFNLSFFVPKKDQCDYCTAFEQMTTQEKASQLEEYNQHHKEKTLAREEKERDKSSNKHVAVYDLQATLPCPKGETSNFYYISKLNVYNFTIFNLKTKDVECYVWHEGHAHRGADEIGTCVLKYLESINSSAELQGSEIDVVFYSDNCGGQQKNRFMLSAYLYAISHFKYIRSITHKYLITGHSQNEGDSAHSVIERQITRHLKSSAIYTPEQYYTLIRTAKKTGKPYKVTEMCYSDFFDLKNLVSQMEYNNFSKNTDNDAFKLSKDNLHTVFYKNSYTEEVYKQIIVRGPSRKKRDLSDDQNFIPEQAYKRKPGISEKKKDSLLSLFRNPRKQTVPRTYLDYYKNL